MKQAAIEREIRAKWKARPGRSHKGDFGRVFILAGSRGMTGAAHLAAMAALRAGGGLVTLGVPDKVYSVLARREAEVMVFPFPSTPAGSFSARAVKRVLAFLKKQDVLAAGPGLSRNPETRQLVRGLLSKTLLPLVIDADGLNALEGNLKPLLICGTRAVLTPHPGEFQRVFKETLTGSQALREKKAVLIARRFGSVVVLKGHHTVVAGPEGKIFVNLTGNPGMATAGTGDVLTGMIAGLMGQGLSRWDAARFGVYLHGLAGDFSAGEKGEASLTAGDLLDFLPETIRSVRGR